MSQEAPPWEEEQMPDDTRPASLHAERTILGGSLVDPTTLCDLLEYVEEDDFSLDSHRKIFRCISESIETGNNVDIVTVAEALDRKKQLSSIGGRAYLAGLSEGLPRKLSIEGYCRIVRDKAVLRGIISVADKANIRAVDQSEDAQVILEDLEEQLLELSRTRKGQGFETIVDAMHEAGGLDAYIQKSFDPVAITGLATGFSEFDAMTGGLQRKELTILAARPSMGKTAWAINVATNVALEDPDVVVAVFSIEMSKELLYKRMLSSEAGVNTKRSMSGYLSSMEKSRIAEALSKLGDCNLMIDESSEITTTQMRAKCRRLKMQKGRLDLIVVDYLQLVMGTKRYGNREQEVASVSRGLKALAKELDVPVLALAQLGRGSEHRTGDKRPMLSDLRESGQIEQDADIVAFLHREEYYASDDDEDVERGIAELITAKNRNGPTGTRKLAFVKDITKFHNLDRTHTPGGNYDHWNTAS